MFTSILKKLAYALAIAAVLSSGVYAARPCEEPPCGGDNGGTGEPPVDVSDLIFLLRDGNGVPIPSDPVLVEDPETGELVDGGLCEQPIAFNLEDDLLCPLECRTGSDPLLVDVNPLTCAVAAGCEGCTREVSFGRFNEARSPAEVFESQLADVVINLATADCITLDPAGRLVAIRADEDLDDNLLSTIDSPIQSLSMYRQFMLTGFLGSETNPIELPGAPDPHSAFDTAARGLGAASDKSGGVNVDLIHYLNAIMGLSDAATPTFIGKLCETYREEVQGQVQTVEKCFLNYGSDPSDVGPAGAGYAYNRLGNFSTSEQSLPFPAYIPDENAFGAFEYLAFDPATDPLDPRFGIVRGPIREAVFCVDGNGDPVDPDFTTGQCLAGTVDPGYTDGNVGGFAQAGDDTRAVISYMHTNQVPVDYETKVVCDAVPGDNYDVAISEESGLQVPVTYVNGTEREFIVTVQNLSVSPAAATGTVTVTAVVAATGEPIPGSPWVFGFADLLPGLSEAFETPLQFDLGKSATVNWEAVVDAPLDVNPLNNTVTRTTSVKKSGGSGKP